jgi:hypothetical protein
MHYTSVTYRANAPQPGERFKHEHVECSIGLDHNDSPEVALNMARIFVNRALGLDVSEDDVKRAETVLLKAKRAGLR